jgi:adenylosuccinate lyase
VLKHLIRIARQYADTIQVGRTHLLHASPQTFGNAVTEYVVRLGIEIEKLEKEAMKLVGKFSGPVGTYGPSSLIVKNPVRFEKRLLSHLGLPAGRYSTQKTLQQPFADVFHRLTSIMAIFGDLGDSFRKLQATEVAEVSQAKSTQGSSSIMAHKVNPIAFENIKSLDKEETGRMIGVYLDLISDHQRDLTNSASGRFHFEIVEFVASATRTLNRILPKLVVDETQMMKNFRMTGDLIISDPLNTLFTYYGHPNAHAYVGTLCDRSRETGVKVYDLLMEDSSVQRYVAQITAKQHRVLKAPERYIGWAARRTRSEADYWEQKFKLAA